MSKKYNSKICIYCGSKKVSTTADHLVARQFIPITARNGIPKVPCCSKCNNDKSKLEHYAASILPFGSNTVYAQEMLRERVAKRLEKNIKLKKELNKNSKKVWFKSNSGLYLRTLSIPIKSEPILGLLQYYIKGLYYYHWNIALPADIGVWARSFNYKGILMFRKTLFGINPKNILEYNLGDGYLIYRCTRNEINKYISAWEFSFYKGAKMFGSSSDGKKQQIYLCGVTAPKDKINAT
jgi:hypothetical protein